MAPLHFLELLQDHARIRPKQPALIAPEREPLAYRELCEHIIRIGTFLQSQHLHRGHRVAVVLPEGPELASSILAVAAITTCAPLNPSLRLSEYRLLLQDLKADAVLVQADQEGAAAEAAVQLGIRTLVAHAEPRAASGLFTIDGMEAAPRLQIQLAHPPDAALLLHTSGTTARPKQVALSHISIYASARNIAASLSLGPEDSCLNIMLLSHVHGLIGALLAPLAAGGSVILPGRFDPTKFAHYLNTLNPTWFTATPAILQDVAGRVAANPGALPKTLRFVRSASAPLPERLRRQFEEQFSVPIIEAYGMTEASHQIASNPLPPAKRKAGSVGVSTGPSLQIQDTGGNSLAAGEIGEIVIRGDTVITGYASNGEANSSSFRNGWMRTGDLGHLDEDGYLFIGGRLKETINRGGEKISPHEIEAVLDDHPMVMESGVFAVPDSRLGEEIAAMVVLRHNAATGKELQEFVATRLADFKVPRHIAVRDSLPRSSTGKLQRNKLLEMFAAAPADVINYDEMVEHVAPTGSVEQQLAAIWRTVLAVEQVGLNDNFLALGGNSIQAATVIAAIRRSLGVDLSIVSFFNNPTIRKQAQEIERRPRSATNDSMQPSRFGEPDAAPLSHTQQLIYRVSQDRLVAHSSAFNRLSALQISEPLDARRLEDSINGIVRRHELLCARLIRLGGVAYWTHGFAGPVEIRHFDLSDRKSEQRLACARELAIEIGNLPFQLERERLIRFALLRLGGECSILIVSSHVLVFDGWSMRLFVKELAAYYQALELGCIPDLPPLPIQYTDFARWQARRMQAGDMETSVAYWKRQMTKQPPRVEFDRRRWASPENRFELRSHKMQLDAELTGKLRAVARQYQVTLYMVLLATLKVMLSRLGNERDIVVLTNSAGRSRGETQGLIGNFVTTLPLRSDVAPEEPFCDYLATIRRLCLEAWQHEEAPFASLMTELFGDKSLLLDPISPVLFVFKNFSIPPITVGGTTFAPYGLDYQTEPFGLILKIYEENDRLSCSIQYNEALLSPAQASQFASCYKLVLGQVVNNPQIQIRQCLKTRQLIQALGWRPLLAHAIKALMPQTRS